MSSFLLLLLNRHARVVSSQGLRWLLLHLHLKRGQASRCLRSIPRELPHLGHIGLHRRSDTRVAPVTWHGWTLNAPVQLGRRSEVVLLLLHELSPDRVNTMGALRSAVVLKVDDPRSWWVVSFRGHERLEVDHWAANVETDIVHQVLYLTALPFPIIAFTTPLVLKQDEALGLGVLQLANLLVFIA